MARSRPPLVNSCPSTENPAIENPEFRILQFIGNVAPMKMAFRGGRCAQ